MKIKFLILSCLTLFAVSCGVEEQNIELNNQEVLIEENKAEDGTSKEVVLEGNDIVIDDIKKEITINEVKKDIILESDPEIIENKAHLLEGKDIIESYYNNIKEGKLKEAYALKKTTQTFEEFKNIYLDTKYLEIFSISENINGNYNTVVEINNILYSAVLKEIDGKIETIEANEHKRKYYDTNTKEIKDKIIYSSKKIDDIIYLPIFKNHEKHEGPLDSRKYLYADGYAAVYSPLSEIGDGYKPDGRYNGFVAGVFSRRYSFFKYYELTSNKLLKFKPYYKDLRGSMLYLFLSNGEKENITFKDINRLKKTVNGYDIFIESFNNSLYQCMSFIERLDDNYVLQYFGCGEKDIYNIGNIEFIDKNKIKTISIKHKEKLSEDIEGDYEIINNALMFVDTKGIRYPLSKSQAHRFNDNMLNCKNIKDYPLKLCKNEYFENYDAHSELFFINTKVYIDTSDECSNFNIEFNNDGKTVDIYCYGSSETTTYDMKGKIIYKK